MIPARTTAPATLNPKLPTSKSSAANWAVCVKSVLVNADDIEAAASSPSTSAWRASIWSGGAHHGVRSGRDRSGRRAATPSRARTGSANSQPNHGIASRYRVRSTSRPSCSVTCRSYSLKGPVSWWNVPSSARLLGQQVVARALQSAAHLRVVRPLPRHRPSAAQHGGSILRPVKSEPAGGDCCITVRHAGPLEGEVVVPGAKNSVLKLMAASLMADGAFEITNVPAIVDVGIMSELLAAIGLTITRPAPTR